MRRNAGGAGWWGEVPLMGGSPPLVGRVGQALPLVVVAVVVVAVVHSSWIVGWFSPPEVGLGSPLPRWRCPRTSDPHLTPIYTLEKNTKTTITSLASF